MMRRPVSGVSELESQWKPAETNVGVVGNRQRRNSARCACKSLVVREGFLLKGNLLEVIVLDGCGSELIEAELDEFVARFPLG